jgi:toxin FitB
MIIADTNVLSELMKVSPDPAVLAWAGRQPLVRLFTTTITMAEVLYGVERLPSGKRRTGLASEAERTFRQDFAGRILTFDVDAAAAYARIVVAQAKSGHPMNVLDAQIAAIALCRGAKLATRNTRDFEGAGVDLINPWTA